MATVRSGRLIAAILLLLLLPTAAGAQEPLWRGHMAAGQSAFEQKDLIAARDQFEAALTAAQDFPADDPRIGLTLNNLATVYNFQGAFAKAEPLLLRAREIWQQAPPPGELHLATTLHNLAGLYFSQGRLDEVEPLLKQALEIRERALPADHPALAKTRESMATLKRSLDQAAKAQQSEAAPDSASGEQAQPKKQVPSAVPGGKEKPTDTKATAARPSEEFAIHLASLRTIEGAKREWTALEQSHPDLLRGLELEVVRVDLGDRGIYQRIVAGHFADRASATALCRRFQAKNQYCAVVKR